MNHNPRRSWIPKSAVSASPERHRAQASPATSGRERGPLQLENAIEHSIEMANVRFPPPVVGLAEFLETLRATPVSAR
ncbi:MAG TPA: hypothetical protein VFZ21_24855 [Gemmatimonadaceae bacterium]|nr:hypothetical protein [Gemmatimonadaceae bacterium]